MVLHAGDNDLIVAREIAAGEGGSHEVYAFGGATGEDYLVAVAGIDELLHLTAYSFVTFGGSGSQMVGTAMDIAVEGAVVVV